MTARRPRPQPEARAARTRRRPREAPGGGWGVLAGIAVATLLLALAAFALQPSGYAAEDIRRSALRTTPDGVAALYRAIARLGRPTSIRLTPMVDAEPLRGTLVLLQPVRRPSPREVHELLEWVRGGGTLIHAPSADSSVLDSLGLARHDLGEDADSTDAAATATDERVTTDGSDAETAEALPSGPEEPEEPAMQADGAVTGLASGPVWSRDMLTEGLSMPGAARYAIAPDTASDNDGDEDTEDAAAAERVPPDPVAYDPLLLTAPDSGGHRWTLAAVIPLGEGRIIAFGDAGPLSNRRAGAEPLAVLAVRAAMAWTSPGDTVFFDEFSQGLGESRSPAGATVDFLLDTRIGRASLHLGLVVLLALFCAGLRLGSPLAPERADRRSAQEHVSALAAVYESAQARRTAAVLMLSRFARASRLPPPRDVAEAVRVVARLEDRSRFAEPLRLIRRGLETDPVDLASIARGIDDHTQRRASA